MATVHLKGNAVHTSGELPQAGSPAPDFTLIKSDLSESSLSDYKGKKVIMNIFPSIDTGVCATSVRKFNERATELENAVVLCISRDTPFAQQRFVSDEELNNVVNLSDVRDGQFGKDYGLDFSDGPLKGLHSRAVVVLNEEGKVVYNEQVNEITEEPDYLSALKAALKN